MQSNVKEYGAVGDGKTSSFFSRLQLRCADYDASHSDDTAAINKAVSEGNRCGLKCEGGSST